MVNRIAAQAGKAAAMHSQPIQLGILQRQSLQLVQLPMASLVALYALLLLSTAL
jgi:hypothetical protein